MILHIMYDEKIISRTISDFETALPGGNKFIIIIARNAKPKYVLDDDPYIIKTRYGSQEFWNAVGDVSSYDYIILHNLAIPSVRFISKINHPRIVWCVWGADLYGGYLTPKGYNISCDKELVKRFSAIEQPIIDKIISSISDYFYRRERIRVLKKIAYISTIDEEIDLLKHYYPEAKHIEKKHFFNYAVDDILKQEKMDNKTIGNDIMIGNSAAIDSNHMDIFTVLSELDLKSRRVLSPLSYGNMAYRDYIIDKGKTLLGDSFAPITEFLPLDDYINVMRGARTYIYGNYRQQGMGNIVMALCWGGAVFLHPQNVLLPYFKRIGCTIFSTEDIPSKLHYTLSADEIAKNRNIMLNTYSRERLIKIIKERFGSNSY